MLSINSARPGLWSITINRRRWSISRCQRDPWYGVTLAGNYQARLTLETRQLVTLAQSRSADLASCTWSRLDSRNVFAIWKLKIRSPCMLAITGTPVSSMGTHRKLAGNVSSMKPKRKISTALLVQSFLFLSVTFLTGSWRGGTKISTE